MSDKKWNVYVFEPYDGVHLDDLDIAFSVECDFASDAETVVRHELRQARVGNKPWARIDVGHGGRITTRWMLRKNGSWTQPIGG